MCVVHIPFGSRFFYVKKTGGPGSGKTMLLSFLSCLLQKYSNPASFAPDAKVKRMTTVFLDKDRGAELCVRAIGGEYYRVKTGEPTGWNPFALPKSSSHSFSSEESLSL
jgi:type IV secretion system protein VirB4